MTATTTLAPTDAAPCPFCGSIGLDFVEGSTHRWGRADCSACGASTGEVRRAYPDDAKWHAAAIAEWNRRAPAPASGEALATALAECRDAFPTPAPGSKAELAWQDAMADPLGVPAYVRECVAAPASGDTASPFGYFRAEPFGWTDCAESDEGAKPLYEAPPVQEVQREEVCKCCGEGSARLVVTRECDTCTSVYAGMSEYAVAKNARAPLSAPQIAAMYLEAMGQQHMFSMVEGAVTRFTRAVEKHHGITAAQKETPNVP